MTIQFSLTTLVYTIRQKSHLEVQDIPDPQARDNARAGLDKDDEIRRCIGLGEAQVRRRCWRFLSDEYTDTKGHTTRPGNGNVTFVLNLSERRGLDKADALSGAMEKLIIEYTLALFYSTVNQPELSNKHSKWALDAGNELEELLYAKKPPRV